MRPEVLPRRRMQVQAERTIVSSVFCLLLGHASTAAVLYCYETSSDSAPDVELVTPAAA